MEAAPEAISLWSLFVGLAVLTFVGIAAVLVGCAPFVALWWLWERLRGDD